MQDFFHNFYHKEKFISKMEVTRTIDKETMKNWLHLQRTLLVWTGDSSLVLLPLTLRLGNFSVDYMIFPLLFGKVDTWIMKNAIILFFFQVHL